MAEIGRKKGYESQMVSLGDLRCESSVFDSQSHEFLQGSPCLEAAGRDRQVIRQSTLDPNTLSSELAGREIKGKRSVISAEKWQSLVSKVGGCEP